MTPQLKQMEVQLEEEYEDKQKALREKRELESKLSTLSDQVRGNPYSYLTYQPKTGDLEDREPGMGSCSTAGTKSQGLMRASSTTQAFLISQHDLDMPREASLLILESVKIGKVSSQHGKDSRKSIGGAHCLPEWCPPQVNQRDFESEKRLRKDLKRTKALLADAQIMLDHLKNNAPSKREIAQLKNQVPCSVNSTGSRGNQEAHLFIQLSSLLLVSLAGS